MKRWFGPVVPVDYDSESVQVWTGLGTKQLVHLVEHWDGEVDADELVDGFEYPEEHQPGSETGANWITVETYALGQERAPTQWQIGYIPVQDGATIVGAILKSNPDQLPDLEAIVDKLRMAHTL